ncbi:hypothetical protein ACFQY9_08675 [Microvirga aerilata]|uniref:hypothetical protein n=1 Tax=Microvirga aerilata TaxID=670292 RepID=UPI003639A74C
MTWINARRYRSDAIFSEAIKILAVGLMALSTSACSLALGTSALDDDEPKATGAIATKAVTALSSDLDEEDWRRAKAALGVALDPQGRAPRSRGTIPTPRGRATSPPWAHPS